MSEWKKTGYVCTCDFKFPRTADRIMSGIASELSAATGIPIVWENVQSEMNPLGETGCFAIRVKEKGE